MKNPVFDKDLTPLLKKCTNDELDQIVQLVLSAPSQTLTVQKNYREHSGDHKSYIDEIVYEITSFGGNTIANLVRGHGVPYSEMVRDVAGRLMIEPSITDTTATLEEKIILKILKLAYDKLSVEDRIALGELINLSVKADGMEGEEFPEAEVSANLATSASSLVGDHIQNAIERASRSTKMRQALVATVRSGMMKLALLPLGGPVSWAAAAGQAVYDLFGPNYTRALSIIAQIGLLRQKYQQMEHSGASSNSIAEAETWADMLS
jgi:uncharacterized protein YaaW (UPF0174 family)